MIDKLDRKAANCVESLKEMIEETGTKVVMAESHVGKVELLILNKIRDTMPGMIVIGRDSFSGFALNQLIDQATCPVLCVPQSAAPRLPLSIALTSSLNVLVEKKVDALFKIIQNTTHEVTVVDVVRDKHSNGHGLQRTIASVKGNILVNCQQHIASEFIPGILNFIEVNAIDLLCVTYKRPSFLKRIFKRDPSLDLISRTQIPMMIVKM
jgi:nucleotide-binding universal stress UspA family protein